MEIDDWKPVFGHPTGEWYRWFAWRPTRTLDRGWRWLRFVWKRPCQKDIDLPGPITTWFQTVVEQ